MKEPKNVKERTKKPPYRQGHNPERKCFAIIIRKKDIHKILNKLKRYWAENPATANYAAEFYNSKALNIYQAQ